MSGLYFAFAVFILVLLSEDLAMLEKGYVASFQSFTRLFQNNIYFSIGLFHSQILTLSVKTS